MRRRNFAGATNYEVVSSKGHESDEKLQPPLSCGMKRSRTFQFLNELQEDEDAQKRGLIFRPSVAKQAIPDASLPMVIYSLNSYMSAGIVWTIVAGEA